MSADDIIDRKSLENWLRDRSGPDASAIAHRSACRVFPIFRVTTEESGFRLRDLATLAIFRCLLTSGVAAVSPTPEVRAAAADAAYAAYAADAAAYAAAAAAYADAYDAYADAAADAAADADRYAKAGSYIWEQIREDARALERGEKPLPLPLWSIPLPDWFRHANQTCLSYFANSPELWSFWSAWWDGVLSGNHIDGTLQQDIALIPDEDWKQGPAHIAKKIQGLINQPEWRVSKETEQSATKLFRAALGKFTLDQINDLITIGPFPEDIGKARDPDIIGRFLEDAEEVRERLDSLQRAFAKEGRAMQGAGGLVIYLGNLIDELSRARQLSLLRVNMILEWSMFLQHCATTPGIRDEIAPLDQPLSIVNRALDTLIRNYFASALVRVSPLRDIRSAEDVALADLLQDIQRGLKTIRQADRSVLTPMSPELSAVFDAILIEMERMVRTELSVPAGASRTGIRKEFDFLAAQVSVSLLMYREAMPKFAGTAIRLFSSGANGAKHVNDLKDFVNWVLGLFR